MAKQTKKPRFDNKVSSPVIIEMRTDSASPAEDVVNVVNWTMVNLSRATQSAMSASAQVAQVSADQLVGSTTYLGKRVAKAIIKAHLNRQEKVAQSANPLANNEAIGAKGQQIAKGTVNAIKQIREAADPRMVVGGLVGLTAGEIVGTAVGGVAGAVVAGPAGAVVGAQVGGFTVSMLGLKIGTDAIRDQKELKRTREASGEDAVVPRRVGVGRFLQLKSGERMGEMVGLTSGATLGLVIAGPAGGLVGAVIGEAFGGYVAEDLTKSRSDDEARKKSKEDTAQWLERFGKNTVGEAVTILAAGSVGSIFGPSGRLVGHRVGLIVSKQVKWHKLSDDQDGDVARPKLSAPPPYLLQGSIASEPENAPDMALDSASLTLSSEPPIGSDALLAEPPVQFTERQLEVLTLLAAQCDADEIAAQLGITPATVHYHKRNICQKLGVQSPEGAVYTAVELLPHLLDD